MAETKPKERIRVAAGRQGAPMPVIVPREPLPATTGNLSALLMQVATDKDVDADKARAMFDLYKDVRAHEAQIAFTKSFFELKKKLPRIDKDGKIEHADKGDGKPRQKSTFATYPHIMGVIEPLNQKHGFALGSWLEPGEGGKMNIVTQLDHELGHFRRSMFPATAEATGAKNNMQAWGSSESYGLRYNIIALYQIVSKAPGDRDTDGNVGNFRPTADGGLVEATESRKVSPAEIEEMRLLMEDCGVTERQVLTSYQIDEIKDLPADILPGFRKRCQDHKANQKGSQRG